MSLMLLGLVLLVCLSGQKMEPLLDAMVRIYVLYVHVFPWTLDEPASWVYVVLALCIHTTLQSSLFLVTKEIVRRQTMQPMLEMGLLALLYVWSFILLLWIPLQYTVLTILFELPYLKTKWNQWFQQMDQYRKDYDQKFIPPQDLKPPSLSKS